MKRLIVLIICILILTGCPSTFKSAKDVGQGVSVENQATKTIKHLRIEKYIDGHLTASENVINANNSAFKKGEIVIFDIPVQVNEEVAYLVKYSENLDATNDVSTNKIEINPQDAWTNLILNEHLQLEVEK